MLLHSVGVVPRWLRPKHKWLKNKVVQRRLSMPLKEPHFRSLMLPSRAPQIDFIRRWSIFKRFIRNFGAQKEWKHFSVWLEGRCFVKKIERGLNPIFYTFPFMRWLFWNTLGHINMPIFALMECVNATRKKRTSKTTASNKRRLRSLWKWWIDFLIKLVYSYPVRER